MGFVVEDKPGALSKAASLSASIRRPNSVPSSMGAQVSANSGMISVKALCALTNALQSKISPWSHQRVNSRSS